MVISRFVADFCHLSMKKGFVKWVPVTQIMDVLGGIMWCLTLKGEKDERGKKGGGGGRGQEE